MKYTYKELDARLTGRCYWSRKLENHTYAVRRGEGYSIAVKLHDTEILTFFYDGRVTYDSGGWRTVTTKDRMNGYGPALISSEHGRWYALVHGREYVFEDGMTVGPRGGVTGAIRRASEFFKGDKIIKARARTLSNALVEAAPLTMDDGGLGFSSLVGRALTHARVGGAWWDGFFRDRRWLDVVSLRANGGTGRTLNSHAARFIYRELIRGAGLQA